VAKKLKVERKIAKKMQKMSKRLKYAKYWMRKSPIIFDLVFTYIRL